MATWHCCLRLHPLGHGKGFAGVGTECSLILVERVLKDVDLRTLLDVLIMELLTGGREEIAMSS